MKFVFTVLLLIGLLTVTGSAQTVSGSIGPVRRGGSVSGSVLISIPKGIHINSNRPSSEFLIPTSVNFTVAEASVSDVVYPPGKEKRFAFSEEPLNVYEGKVRIRFRLSVPASHKGKAVSIRASVTFQPCTDEVCYPPRTIPVILKVRLKR